MNAAEDDNGSTTGSDDADTLGAEDIGTVCQRNKTGTSRLQLHGSKKQKFQQLVKLQICFEVSLVYLTILEAAPTVTICDGVLESVLRVMAP